MIANKGYVLYVHEERNKSIENMRQKELTDYKFFCFEGVPRTVLTCTNRFSKNGLCEDFFDMEWRHLDMKRTAHPNAKDSVVRPALFDDMKDLAKKLATGFHFLRVDFYEISGRVYFGELTFYPSSGMQTFEPYSWDCKMGNWIELPTFGGVLGNEQAFVYEKGFKCSSNNSQEYTYKSTPFSLTGIS